MYLIINGGLSSVLEELRNRGYLCIGEVARDLHKVDVEARVEFILERLGIQ